MHSSAFNEFHIGLWLFGTNEFSKFFRDLLCLSSRQWKGVVGESIISDLISFTKSTKSLSSGLDIYRYSLSSKTERIPQISRIVPAANTLRLYASTGSFTGRQLDGANLVRSKEKIVLFDLLTANNLLVSLLTPAPIIASLLNHKSGVN